jgi:hypothetical protein
MKRDRDREQRSGQMKECKIDLGEGWYPHAMEGGTNDEAMADAIAIYDDFQWQTDHLQYIGAVLIFETL